MPASPEFHRLISARSFVSRRRIPATILSAIASLCLGALVVCSSLMLWTLTQFSSTGLSFAVRFGDGYPHSEYRICGRLIAALVHTCPPLQEPRSAILALAISSLAFAIIRWGLRTLAGDLLEQELSEEVLRLRQHIHRKSLRLDAADLSGDQTAATDRLFQNATSSLEIAASCYSNNFLSTVPDLATVVFLASLSDWRLFLQTVIPVLLGRMALRAETIRSNNSLRLLSEQVDRGLAKMAEGLKKTRIVTSFGMEKTEQQQFESHLRDYQNRCRQLKRQQRLGHGIRDGILLTIFVIPFVILSMKIVQGYHPALIVLMAICVSLIFRKLGVLDTQSELLSVGSEKAEEVTAYINRIPGVSQVPGAGFLEPMSKTLSFNQIYYQSPQCPELLSGLDLRIGFGETVALLSLQTEPAYALASMISRFIDPDAGQVLIDGKDVRKATLESLRAEALFVGGHDPVFNATVLENITCGQTDISRQQAIDAAKLVHADNFVRSLPRGYETMLGEHGATLDAGQSFRLSLARAAVRSPALLVIEEPQIQLDSETKALLDDAYQRLCVDRTVIFLPFRLSTVKKCQRIVVIHEGRVAVDGDHEHIVRTSELYRHWEYSRFNPFREDTESFA